MTVRAKSKPKPAPILTVPAYLEAVQRLHGLTQREIARTLRASPSAVRRWQRGTLVPSLGRVRAMVGQWGGCVELLILGAALQRFSRTTGLSLDDTVHLLKTGRKVGPTRRRPSQIVRDRRQLSLPMGRPSI